MQRPSPAFKHNIRDEWLARHLGQEKPKSMAALTSLMTRFCAGEDSWLARSNNLSKKAGSPDTKAAMAGRVKTKINAALTATAMSLRQSTPDSEAPSPINGRSHSKEPLRARPIWTEYSTAPVKYMEPPKSQLTTPTEIVGYSSKQEN